MTDAPTTLAETILRDVPRHTIQLYVDDLTFFLDYDVLAALTAAMDPAIAERAGELAWDETYDTMMEVERNPTGAFEAIQSQAASITALLAQNAALRADKEALHLALGEASKTIVEIKAERDALRAEVEWWKQDDREAWDKCEERRIAQEAAEAQIAALTARVEGLTGALRRIRNLPDEIEEQVKVTRAYAADSGMDRNQIVCMEICTSHLLDHARTLRAALSATDATTEKGGDAHAVNPRHAPHEASPGVTAGADAAQAREAAMQELIDAYEDIMDYGIVFAKKPQQHRLNAAKEKLKEART